MQFFSPARAGCPRLISVWLLAIAMLTPLLLSGCGGGSGINGTSTSDQGFRIIPDGGQVVPLPAVTLVTSPNAISAGVQVSAASVNPATLPAYLNAGAASAGTSTVAAYTSAVAAYQITFSPDNPTVNASVTPATLTLTYPASSLPSNATLNIYRYDGTQWVALPGAGVSPSAGSVTASMGTLNALAGPVIIPYLKSGVYAIFATAPPAHPAL